MIEGPSMGADSDLEESLHELHVEAVTDGGTPAPVIHEAVLNFILKRARLGKCNARPSLRTLPTLSQGC